MKMRLNYSTVLIASATMAAAFCLTAIPKAQTPAPGRTPRPARTPDGHPNLNGIWQATTTANWDLLPHAMRPAVAPPGVYPDVPVLAAPVLALGAAGGVPPGPGVVVGNVMPYKTEDAVIKNKNAAKWLTIVL